MGSASVSQTLPHCSAVMSLHLSPSPSDCRLFPLFLLCTLLCISFICLLFFLCLSSFYSFLSSIGYSAAAETLIYLCFKACLYLDKCSICTHANTHARTRKVFLFISAQGSAMETGKDNWTNSLHHWQCHLEWIAYYSKQHNLFLSQGIKCNCFVRCFLHLPAVASAPWQSGCLDVTFYF